MLKFMNFKRPGTELSIYDSSHWSDVSDGFRACCQGDQLCVVTRAYHSLQLPLKLEACLSPSGNKHATTTATVSMQDRRNRISKAEFLL